MNNIVDLACQLEETCRFCYPPEKERILYATENFYVMASLGPIVEGYLLIVSKKHIPAITAEQEFDALSTDSCSR